MVCDVSSTLHTDITIRAVFCVGILYKSSYELRSRIYNATEDSDVREVEAEVQYPLTPPPSDDSSASSRSLSPECSAQPKLHVTTVSVFPKTRTRQANERDGVKRRKTGTLIVH